MMNSAATSASDPVSRIEAVYLPNGDPGPMKLSDATLGVLRSSLNARRAEQVRAEPHVGVVFTDRVVSIGERSVDVRV